MTNTKTLPCPKNVAGCRRPCDPGTGSPELAGVIAISDDIFMLDLLVVKNPPCSW